MTIEALTGSRPWLAAGWTMLHFLWVGGAIGLVAALGRRALRGAVPEARYGFALLGLAAMAVAPAAIVALLPASPRDDGPARESPRAVAVTPLPPPSAAIPASGPWLAALRPATIPREALLEGRREGSSLERWLGIAAAGLPWVWIAGTPATFALLAAGLVGAERLRRRSRTLADGELTELARRLADALGIIRPVALGVCDRLAVPILIGVVRPLILLPAAAVAGWGPEQLEMALLHELAHVRRCDNLVNLVQRVIESLLFFHPAVWWVSGWVRLEREHCCDRLVVARTGRARPYAELLADLALYRARPGRTALAMAESPVVARIRCILNPEDHLMPLSRPVVALAAVLLVAPAVLIASQAAAPGPDEAHAKQPKAAGPIENPDRARIAAAPGPDEAYANQPKAAGPLENPDRARIEELVRRTRHGADMFLGVQERIYALIQIAGVQVRAGDHEAARRTFRQAEELAGTVGLDDSTFSPHILHWVVQAETRHGFRDEAVAAARRLSRLAEAPTGRDSQKADLYRNLIESQIQLGDRAGAEETLQAARKVFTTSNDPVLLNYGPAFIVSNQAASGDLAGALRMVRDPDVFRRVRPESVENIRHDALFHIVRAIKANNREGADQVLAEALRVVADREYARPWIRTVMRNQDLEEIAWAYARFGQFDEALKSARMIDAENLPGGLAEEPKATFLDEQRFRKVEALAGVSREQAKAGDRAGALGTAREAARIAEIIRSEPHKYMPTWHAAGVLAAAGDFDGARRLADTLSRDHRIGIYEDIAAAQRDAGDAAGARTTLRAALDLARQRLTTFDAADRDRKGPVNPERYRLLEGVARLQARLGDVKEAIETTTRINSGNQRIEALKGIATDLASAGDLDGALKAIGEINSPQSEAEALKSVASVFSHRAEPSPAR
jgi:beta-lactamase regulating signal transducer with metallopeptidase domain